LRTTISNRFKSNKESLFVADNLAQQQPTNNQNSFNQSSTNRAKAINDALVLADVDFGTQEDHNANQQQSTVFIQECIHDCQPGWACYPKNRRNTTHMNLQSMILLHTLFKRGNEFKNRRYTADRAQSLLFDEVAQKDWYEQTILTESRIKAFFGMTVSNQQKLIRNATPVTNDFTTIDALPQANAMRDNCVAEEITHQLEVAVEAVELQEEEERSNGFNIDTIVEESINLSTPQR
jgi:hypothetical protein